MLNVWPAIFSICRRVCKLLFCFCSRCCVTDWLCMRLDFDLSHIIWDTGDPRFVSKYVIFIYSPLHSFIHWIISIHLLAYLLSNYLLNYLLIYLFVYSFINSFTNLFNHSAFYLSIHLYIYLFIQLLSSSIQLTQTIYLYAGWNWSWLHKWRRE